jgi:TorA maturation chaperone TorD
MPELISQESFAQGVDEIDRARAQEYALLATLLLHSPDSMMISRLAELAGDANAEDAAREYLALFAGLKDGGLLPYSSHYLTDTLYGPPLARLRQALQGLGIETARHLSEPRITPQSFVKSWQALPTAALRRRRVSSVSSSKSISCHGCDAFLSISNMLKPPTFTQPSVCTDVPLWISR